MPESRKWYEQFCSTAQEFIEVNGIKGNPQGVKSGLDSIPQSWDDLRVSHTSLLVVMLMGRQRRSRGQSWCIDYNRARLICMCISVGPTVLSYRLTLFLPDSRILDTEPDFQSFLRLSPTQGSLHHFHVRMFTVRQSFKTDRQSATRPLVAGPRWEVVGHPGSEAFGDLHVRLWGRSHA